MPDPARPYFLPAVVVNNYDQFVDRFHIKLEDILDRYDFEDAKMRECLDLAVDSMRAEYALGPSAVHITRESTDSLLEDIEIIGQNSTDSMVSRGMDREDAAIRVESLYNYLAAARRDLSRCRDEYDQLYILDVANNEVKIPAEKPAPVRVSVEKNRLTLVTTKTQIGSLTEDANDRIRESLRHLVESALENLGINHNVDPRFAPACVPFLQHLSAPLKNLSVEGLGLNWQVLSELLSIYKDELPLAVFVQLDRALKSTNILLSQYEEWRAYLGAEAVAGLSEQELSRVLEETQKLVDDLSDNTDSIDPEISARFREIISPAAQHLVGLDTIATPLIGSLTNVLSQMSFLILQEAPWIASASKQFVVFAEKPLQNSLVLLSMGIITKYAPTLSDLPPFKFLRDTYELTIKKFPWAKDTILK